MRITGGETKEEHAMGLGHAIELAHTRELARSLSKLFWSSLNQFLQVFLFKRNSAYLQQIVKKHFEIIY